MQNRKGVEFFYTFSGGDLGASIQMDLPPGIFCTAHFVIIFDREQESIDDYVNADRLATVLAHRH
jgi:hypothetical protein